jgi:hypothetical protein
MFSNNTQYVYPVTKSSNQSLSQKSYPQVIHRQKEENGAIIALFPARPARSAELYHTPPQMSRHLFFYLLDFSESLTGQGFQPIIIFQLICICVTCAKNLRKMRKTRLPQNAYQVKDYFQMSLPQIDQ